MYPKDRYVNLLRVVYLMSMLLESHPLTYKNVSNKLNWVKLLGLMVYLPNTAFFSHIIVCVHVSLLLGSMLTHGYLPAVLMKSAIVPILKIRQGPIAIVTA